MMIFFYNIITSHQVKLKHTFQFCIIFVEKKLLIILIINNTHLDLHKTP